jgi:hypothetical protein
MSITFGGIKYLISHDFFFFFFFFKILFSLVLEGRLESLMLFVVLDLKTILL